MAGRYRALVYARECRRMGCAGVRHEQPSASVMAGDRVSRGRSVFFTNSRVVAAR